MSEKGYIDECYQAQRDSVVVSLDEVNRQDIEKLDSQLNQLERRISMTNNEVTQQLLSLLTQATATLTTCDSVLKHYRERIGLTSMADQAAHMTTLVKYYQARCDQLETDNSMLKAEVEDLKKVQVGMLGTIADLRHKVCEPLVRIVNLKDGKATEECRACRGTGRAQAGDPCPYCEGEGTTTTSIIAEETDEG